MSDGLLFVRLDVRVRAHPKFLSVSAGARWLWISAVGWCGEYLTDGRVPLVAVPTLTPDPGTDGLLSELARVGLVTLDGDAFHINDYLEYQESAADVRARRERNRANGALGGRPPGSKTRRGAHSETQSETHPVTDSPTESSRHADADADAEEGTTSLPPQPPAERGESEPRQRRLPVVDGDRVTTAEHTLAEAVLAAFNELARTRRTLTKQALGRLVRCIRLAPDLDADGHRRVIAAHLARPWWDGPPGLEHLYRPDLFEQARAAADAPPQLALTGATNGRRPDTGDALANYLARMTEHQHRIGDEAA